MTEVIIIGGGLAGLTAANRLHAQGIDFQLVEAADRVGGRVKTDVIDGYRFDHGFQVMLTAYPETIQLLDYKALKLKKFLPGAMLLQENGKTDRIGDPLRDAGSLLPTLTASVGSVFDKMRILRLKMRLSNLSRADIFSQPSKTTLAALQEDYGFNEKMIDRFFKPFFSGIFLETELKTDRRMFDFVFKMFGEGYAVVPELGMEEISKQLAANLPQEKIHTGVKVQSLDKEGVILSDGGRLSAKKILIATQATGLVKDYAAEVNTRYVSTTHVHFSTDNPPLDKAVIALNTEKNRLVNNLCVINKVAKSYAPEGKHLISLSVVGNQGFSEKDLVKNIKTELKKWFGNATDDWQHLHTRHIDYALPEQIAVRNDLNDNELKINENTYVCGDFLLNGSINAAIKTGRKAADLIGEELRSVSL